MVVAAANSYHFTPGFEARSGEGGLVIIGGELRFDFDVGYGIRGIVGGF